ncbi:acyl carrier protein [Pseudoalteromonas luteoviolacea]|uniref:Carrier domain-containing protein n=1 Tax=Pseudoalteromonas luteoviolacea DSM 6061 TaxID=1365250 RepID=A0A161XUM2_9GAMM|nr:acyl carrier protein [Pseudoalteromonas luteoviolacea]KZN34644.1 hypothetical protein N475_19060 [Pseudoalteromonas luteoviolacea DSM 6061]KZN53809.1 hypothetical protein N474_19755 [Pseudoalteromonas luteoviolacea CPMOR-2]MBE0389633.1 hypothetical protein [Pseudoalteromonas luteoviolacea DSM 6061]TQF67733.1 acyl carrier protein [Pseudoalteromonas luteoviolacea]
MINKEQVTDIVYNAICAYLDVERAELSDTSQLEDEWQLDSTEMVCVAVDMEKELGFKLRGLKFSELETISDVINEVLRIADLHEAQERAAEVV